MEIVEIIDDYLDLEDNENEMRVRIRRPRTIRPRPDYLAAFDEKDFRSRFRLIKGTVQRVFALIRDDISPPTMRNAAIPAMCQLLLTLRYLATGSYLMSAGDFAGVSPSSACRIIKRVTEAIARLRPRFVKFPQDLGNTVQGFYRIARFPRVMGAIDCTHVNIISPGGHTAENYRNRKHNFSINVQAVCDSNLTIMDVVARWPGSSHDQTIFINSAVKQKIENGNFGNYLLLGDNGYENKPYLLTPFLDPNSEVQNLYNESQIRTRNVIERCFGVIKNRFPVLRRQVTLSLARVQAIIVACVVLHNLAVEEKEANFGVYLEDIETPEQRDARLEYERRLAAPIAEGRVRDPRQSLLDDYFATLIELNH